MPQLPLCDVKFLPKGGRNGLLLDGLIKGSHEHALQLRILLTELFQLPRL
jgi:hypothetical protein